MSSTFHLINWSVVQFSLQYRKYSWLVSHGIVSCTSICSKLNGVFGEGNRSVEKYSPKRSKFTKKVLCRKYECMKMPFYSNHVTTTIFLGWRNGPGRREENKMQATATAEERHCNFGCNFRFIQATKSQITKEQRWNDCWSAERGRSWCGLWAIVPITSC